MNLSTNRTFDVVQIHDEGSLVAEMYGGSFEERVERGRVMAASTSLLAAAGDLLEHDTGSEELAALRAAVRKARGEEGND